MSQKVRKTLKKLVMLNSFQHLSHCIRSRIKFGMTPQNGFSILEVIIAVAIFVTFAVGSVVALISGLNTNRLGSEVTIANQYTAEGLEAARSIKNQSWSTLITKSDAGNTGVAVSGGVWGFSGTSNTLASDTRFTRTISITSVARDGSGNI